MSQKPQTKPKHNTTYRLQDWMKTLIKARLFESRREQEVEKEAPACINECRGIADLSPSRTAKLLLCDKQGMW